MGAELTTEPLPGLHKQLLEAPLSDRSDCWQAILLSAYGSGFAMDRVGGTVPASEKMGTEEIAVEPGMTPSAEGGESNR